MKRKLTAMLAFALLASGFAMAQGRGGDPARRAENRKQALERQALEQAKELKLDDPTTLWFCNLYIEYQTEMGRIREEARQQMPHPGKRDEASQDEEPGQMREKEMKKLSDEEAEKLIVGSMDLSEKELKLKREYYPRFREKLAPSQLVRIFVRPQRNGGGRGWNNNNNFGPGRFGGPGFPPPGRF
ncbi:MAG: hypothetical protein IJ659_03765 [Alloprevotella sp.]|nr:hypothetical protein [Alloprevotella sp.]